MRTMWGPSVWGRRLLGVRDWEVSLNEDEVAVSIADEVLHARVEALGPPQIRPGLLWSTVDLQFEEQRIVLQGVSKRTAKHLSATLESAREQRLRLSTFDVLATEIAEWFAALDKAVHLQLSRHGWLTREFINQWDADKPLGNLAVLLEDPMVRRHAAAQTRSVREAIEIWSRDLLEFVQHRNEQHLQRELHECRNFFDRVERAPLTPEQRRAVICFDNRVQVIAAAGSGKTSTMVAKAGYALHRNLVPADKILLLAFNTDAAQELRQRLVDRLQPLGLGAAGVTAQTFHAFGLSVIGKATGRKPTLAPWVEAGKENEQLRRIVDGLRSGRPAFRHQWDLFRLVFSRDLPASSDREANEPEDWDTNTKAAGFRTLQGEVVKSHGERVIADWLFFNGVRYAYEMKYKHDTTDASHRQYAPDFYFPDIDVYHEHFALDRDGRPPADFEGYLDGVSWKRSIHRQHGTTLLETTSADLWDGSAFQYLTRELEARGVVLRPDADRPVPGREPLEDHQLLQIFRTFLTHAKSNRLDESQLRQRLETQRGGSRIRSCIFLSLFAEVRKEWDRLLELENYIDFEDMLNLAAEQLSSGRFDAGYQLVMVDEMQDASAARARLVAALVNQPGRHLFAVGDDWQSINRFAGADISVMTDFKSWLGPSEVLRLETTFRSPQSLCDMAGSFVQKNPAQLRKNVRSTAQSVPKPVTAIAVNHAGQYATVLMRYLGHLDKEMGSQSVLHGHARKLHVRILGRYRKLLGQVRDECLALNGPTNKWKHLRVEFQTVHGSKGLEADYVVVLGMTAGLYGFPGTMSDDPVLSLAMPDEDVYPAAEERRLFYVALTRAKCAVLLLTIAGKESSFVLELVTEHGVRISNPAGLVISRELCPACRKGYMVQRKSTFGQFFGCSRFPACRHTCSGQ